MQTYVTVLHNDGKYIWQGNPVVDCIYAKYFGHETSFVDVYRAIGDLTTRGWHSSSAQKTLKAIQLMDLGRATKRDLFFIYLLGKELNIEVIVKQKVGST